MNCLREMGFAAVTGPVLSLPWCICILTVVVAALTIFAVHHHYAGKTRCSEDKLLADVAEKAPVSLLQLGPDGMIQWANRAELELLGYTRQDYAGKNAADFYADSIEGRNVVARLARGETLQEYQTTLRARDGSLRNVLISSTTDMENGRLLRARLFTRDITGRRRAEEEIHRLNQELEQRVQQRTAQLEAANKEMESFSYSVSHDLRAPLRALRGFTEVLLEVHASQLDSRGQDFLRRACAASFQMEKLIEDLLKLAQVSRADIQTEEVNLSQLAGDIAADLANSDSSRTTEFVIASDCVARGDPRLIRLALENLMRNSWKFSSKRSEARIEFGRTDGDDSAFFVRDNGAGFDMAYSKRLFGVFQRLHAATEFPGTGVGLATVQRIMNRHGGRTWAVGTVGEGATFYFTLPKANEKKKNPVHHHERLEPATANSPG
jgi:PAS domain S-box-containing protein